MAQGLRFADVAERMRRAFFDQALAEAGGQATDSKISVKTGLQRRDVARLRAADSPAPPAPDARAQLIALWLARNGGAPLPARGDGSFDALAWEVRRDVHPSSLRDALQEAGAIQIDGDRVELLRRAHVPLTGSEAQLDYLARNVGDHLDVAVGNVMGEGPSFDLAVHYDGLDEAAARQLQDLWRARMAPVLEELNTRAAALQQSAPGSIPDPRRGVFQIGGRPMKRAVLFLLVLGLLAACAPRLPDPCGDQNRDGGIGGTGQCDSSADRLDP